MAPLVIIGSGLAGYTLAREFRKLDRVTPITLVTREAGDFYSKPMLSTALASGKTAEQLITTARDAIATQLNLTVVSEVAVERIDRAAKALHLGQGVVINYSSLVLALGADPIRIPLAGDAADAVISVNELSDYAAFRRAIHTKKNVTILGAGLIGCEFANDLIAGGYQVDVIDLAPLPLGRLLPEPAARELQSKLAAAGVRWHLGTTVREVNRAGDQLRLHCASGEVIESDAVLSAIGLRPRTALAQASGLNVAQGIVVDDQLRTNDPVIYALGDCAQVQGHVLPYVMPIMQAARALALVLTGQPSTVSYPAMPVVVKTPAMPTVVSPPAKEARGEWKIIRSQEGLEARYEDAQQHLLGFALLGAATARRAALTKELPPILA